MDETTAWELLAAQSGGIPQRPSWIEMLAQQQLMLLLKPAVGWVLEVLAVRFSESSGPLQSVVWNIPRRLLLYQDECFYVLLFFLESHYLRYYDASFAENFYGLYRRSMTSPLSSKVRERGHTYSPNDPRFTSSRTLEDLRQLSEGEAFHHPRRDGGRFLKRESEIRYDTIGRRGRFSSLLYLVLVPYLKGKLDDFYRRLSTRRRTGNDREREMQMEEEIEEEEVEDGARESAREREGLEKLETLFLSLYPYAHAAYEGAHFLYQLFYLYRDTSFYSPDLHLLSLSVQRLTPQVVKKMEAAREVLNRRRLTRIRHLGAPWRWVAWFSYGLNRGLETTMDSMKFFLPFSVFFIQFLRWWYSNERQTLNETATVIPPPPEAFPPDSQGIELPVDKTICPLCGQPRTNAAASVGGYCFCFPCLFRHVETHSTCPVSRLPMRSDQIRKIYEAT